MLMCGVSSSDCFMLGIVFLFTSLVSSFVNECHTVSSTGHHVQVFIYIHIRCKYCGVVCCLLNWLCLMGMVLYFYVHLAFICCCSLPFSQPQGTLTEFNQYMLSKSSPIFPSHRIDSILSNSAADT